MLRSIVAILGGYLVFSLAAVAVFLLAGQDPGAHASRLFMLLGTFVGVGFALAAGWVTARLAPSPERTPWEVFALAALVAVVALVSTFIELHRGRAVWSSVSAILFMAPAVLVGGRARRGGTE